MNLFDAIAEYDSLMSQIEELGGEITPEIAEQLMINRETLESKIKGYHYVIKSKTSEIELAKSEIERLSDQIKSKENLITRLKTIVDIAVEEFGEFTKSGVKKLDLNDLKVWQKKTEALLLEDGLNDERFCKKDIKLSLNYEEAKQVLDVLSNKVLFNFELTPDVKITVDKKTLKEWMIENEIYLQALKKDAEITDVIFEREEGVAGESIDEVEKDIADQKLKDLNVLSYATLKHNRTVIFR